MTYDELKKASDTSQELEPVRPKANGVLVPASTGLWGRLKRIIFDSVDPASRGNSILHDIIIPGVKDMSAGAMMTIIYGKGAGTWKGRGSGQNGGIPYNQFSKSGNPAVETVQPRKKSYKYQEVGGLDKSTAEFVLDLMREQIQNYNHCTIGFMYEQCNIPARPSDEDYGWYNLDNAHVVQRVDGTWGITTPTPCQLDKRS